MFPMATPELSYEEKLKLIRERILAHWTYKVGKDIAEDIAQETLVVLFTKYNKVRDLQDMIPLSYGIAANVHFTVVRKGRPAREIDWPENWEPLAQGPNPETLLVKKQAQTNLTDAIDALGRRCRELFLLKLQGYGYAEIATIMDAPVARIYVWDFRCRRDLKTLLGKAGRA